MLGMVHLSVFSVGLEHSPMLYVLLAKTRVRVSAWLQCANASLPVSISSEQHCCQPQAYLLDESTLVILPFYI